MQTDRHADRQTMQTETDLLYFDGYSTSILLREGVDFSSPSKDPISKSNDDLLVPPAKSVNSSMNIPCKQIGPLPRYLKTSKSESRKRETDCSS